MITPPNGSADTSGMNETVSSDARHRKLFTPIPPPVSSLGDDGTPPKVRPSSPKIVSCFSNCGVACPFRRRSEEHTSELQSLMRISYAVFCLKKKKQHIKYTTSS